MRKYNRMLLGAALIALPLFMNFSIGCDKNSQADTNGPRDLSSRVAEAEKTQAQTQGATQVQAEAMAKAGLQPNAGSIQLTLEQRALLEARLREEKDNSTAALLQEILDRDKQIGDLTKRLAKLQAELPTPQVATGKENHLSMALRFMRGRGLSDEQARTLAARANIMEELLPGWQVYQQYAGGAYVTAVTKGKATVGPTEYLQDQRAALVHDRDSLTVQVRSLTDERTKVQADVESLRGEKIALMTQVSDLTTLSHLQKVKLNSLHYLVGQRKQLVDEGVIIVPLFAKDRMGPKAMASRFDKDLPLDDLNPEVQIKASEVGLSKITKVHVIPGSWVKDQDYTVTLAQDRKNAIIRILDPEKVRNDRVVFALTD